MATQWGHDVKVALVLAAGRGVRVGGPKALLLVDGRSLAVAHVEARLADCDRVVLVTRESIAASLGASVSAPIEGAAHGGERMRLVISHAPDDEGPAGSIAAAVQQGALEDATHVLITPVDIRPASTHTIDLLFKAIDGLHRAARFPHGHPVACRCQVLATAYGAPLERSQQGAPPPLRAVLKALGDGLCVLPDAEDRAVHEELDEIDDVIRATGAPPRFWSPACPAR